jgi:hypothetical protein
MAGADPKRSLQSRQQPSRSVAITILCFAAVQETSFMTPIHPCMRKFEFRRVVPRPGVKENITVSATVKYFVELPLML